MATRKAIVPAVKSAPTRVKITTPAQAVNAYFADEALRTDCTFFTSGCLVLDLALGGGYVLGRVENIIGDKSTGKTLMAIEGSVNFAKTFPTGRIRYGEAESAFDKPYAAALGLPLDRVEWVDWTYTGKTIPKLINNGDPDCTVEHWHDDILEFVNSLKGEPGLYIIDSLDALSSRDELARGISDATFGQEKAKKIGELFRRINGVIESSRCCLMIISQVRDNIGVSFGEKFKRSGGHAMDFYATHCIWLAHVGQIKRTVSKIEQAVGVDILANVKKNKVGLPFRKAKYSILFGYGIDDVTASCDWLVEAGKDALLANVDMSKTGYALYLRSLHDKGDAARLKELRTLLDPLVRGAWRDVEDSFLPKAGKY